MPNLDRTGPGGEGPRTGRGAGLCSPRQGGKMASKSAGTLARMAYQRAKKKYKPGQGGRFAALKKSIAARGKVRNPGAVAAAIGRKKYGKKRFQAMAAAGKKRG